MAATRSREARRTRRQAVIAFRSGPVHALAIESAVVVAETGEGAVVEVVVERCEPDLVLAAECAADGDDLAGCCRDGLALGERGLRRPCVGGKDRARRVPRGLKREVEIDEFFARPALGMRENGASGSLGSMPFAETGPVKLYYERSRGRGPAVLLVMGLGMTLSGWWRTVPVLACSLRVLAFDNRGIGRSDRSDKSSPAGCHVRGRGGP